MFGVIMLKVIMVTVVVCFICIQHFFGIGTENFIVNSLTNFLSHLTFNSQLLLLHAHLLLINHFNLCGVLLTFCVYKLMRLLK
jgi:hypothetical protein